MILIVSLVVKLSLASFARPNLYDARANFHVGLQVTVADELFLAVFTLEPFSLAERNVLLEVPDNLWPFLELLVGAETALVTLLVSVSKLEQLWHLSGVVGSTFFEEAVVWAVCFHWAFSVVGFHEEMRSKSTVLVVVILKDLWSDLDYLSIFDLDNVVCIIALVDILVLLGDGNSLEFSCFFI